MRVGRVVGAAAFFAFATTLAGCPDWDAFTRGYPDAGDAPPGPVGEAGVGVDGASDAGDADASDGGDATADAGPATPGVTIDFEVEASKTYDLTALGPSDWMELHETDASKTNRCKPCTQAISNLDTNGVSFFNYSDDGRTFTWSNGKPTLSGQSTGGVFVEGIGSSIDLLVTASGQRQLLTMHTDTYYAGATVRASMDGIPSASKELEKTSDQVRYAVRIRFAGAAGARLAVSFTESAVVPIVVDNDKPNIALSAVTLAPDN